MANITALMRQSLEIQEKYTEKITNQLLSLPEGTLYQIKKSDKRYFFQNIYKNGSRIRLYLGTEQAKHAQLISDLKRKRFLLGCKKVLEGNVVVLRACLLKYEEFDPAQISSRLAATYENIKDTAKPQLGLQMHQDQQSQPDDQDQLAADWQYAPYPRAEMYEEGLKHEAIGGLWVRSKSEALIAFALNLAHVPFHYEETLEIDSKKIAPDFTILHPVTGERVYWEHFGMMDDLAYATETFKKLVLYGQNGILPGKNLIYTMETNAEPLSIREIQRMITHYLLN
jgi:hypothetical protein